MDWDTSGAESPFLRTREPRREETIATQNLISY